MVGLQGIPFRRERETVGINVMGRHGATLSLVAKDFSS
jgi:hypothetical protein